MKRKDEYLQRKAGFLSSSYLTHQINEAVNRSDDYWHKRELEIAIAKISKDPDAYRDELAEKIRSGEFSIYDFDAAMIILSLELNGFCVGMCSQRSVADWVSEVALSVVRYQAIREYASKFDRTTEFVIVNAVSLADESVLSENPKYLQKQIILALKSSVVCPFLSRSLGIEEGSGICRHKINSATSDLSDMFSGISVKSFKSNRRMYVIGSLVASLLSGAKGIGFAMLVVAYIAVAISVPTAVIMFFIAEISLFNKLNLPFGMDVLLALVTPFAVLFLIVLVVSYRAEIKKFIVRIPQMVVSSIRIVAILMLNVLKFIASYAVMSIVWLVATVVFFCIVAVIVLVLSLGRNDDNANETVQYEVSESFYEQSDSSDYERYDETEAIAPSPSPTKTPTPEPAIVPTPTPTPEEPYCGIWVSASDHLDGGSNKVGNEWTITHYASFDGINYVEIPYFGAWYSVDHPVTLYVKTVIVEDDTYPDEATNKYSISIDTDKSLTASGSYWTINQWTDVVENNGAYRGNSCTWDTDWTITFLYN